MADLRTDYKDDVLDTSVNEERKYEMSENSDGTVSLKDVTEYLQVGDSFGSVDINKTNEEIENVKEELDTKVTNSFTPDCALYSDANGRIVASGAVSSTELGFLNGVTNYIQAQLDSKVAKNTAANLTGVVLGNSEYAYVYSDGDNVNFRYKMSDGNLGYTNLRDICKGWLNGTALHITLK